MSLHSTIVILTENGRVEWTGTLDEFWYHRQDSYRTWGDFKDSIVLPLDECGWVSVDGVQILEIAP